MQEISHYWEGVRRGYAAFESDIRSGTADVYNHEMPGGQYTNLREQARAIGLEHRWPQVEKCYAEVNLLFGDIVKVTPTSKVVGDMALFMVAHGVTAEEVADPDKDIAFPSSVVALFKGEVGFPPDGFPKALSRKVLKGAKPLVGRAGVQLAAVDLEARRAEAAVATRGPVSDQDLASYLMYPKEFREFAEHRAQFEDVSVVPTPVFFNGIRDGEEVAIAIERGKTLVVRLQGRSEPDEEGYCKLFFELNGQARVTRVPKAGLAGVVSAHPKMDEANPNHVGAPMPGTIVTLSTEAGQRVEKGEPLLSLEAMKMETVLTAPRDAVIGEVLVRPHDQIDAKDLVLILSPPAA
jgi:pyruvate carboxylase